MNLNPNKRITKAICFTVLSLISITPTSTSASPEGAAPASEKVEKADPKNLPSKDQKGAYPNFLGGDKGGVWSDLPRPDESWEGEADNKIRKNVWKLTEEEQNKILQKRAKTSTMLGSFYEFNNLLYTTGEPFLMTTSVRAAKFPVRTVHTEDYYPTFAELFESMARQTQTTLRYNPTFLSKWIAVPPAMPLPYTLSLADGWRFEDRGMYVAYIPQLQPVGMDIYMLGRYSELSEKKARSIRNENAMRFVAAISKKARIKQMKEVEVDGSDALYYETKSDRRPENQWRQWSFIKNGQAFVIVSSIDDVNAEKLVPEVQAMVASFKVKNPGPASPGI